MVEVGVRVVGVDVVVVLGVDVVVEVTVVVVELEVLADTGT